MQVWVYASVTTLVFLTGALIVVILWATGHLNPSKVADTVKAGAAFSNYNPCQTESGIRLENSFDGFSRGDQPGFGCAFNANTLMCVYNPDGRPASSRMFQFHDGSASEIVLNTPGHIVNPRSMTVLDVGIAALITTISAEGTLNYTSGSTNPASIHTDLETIVQIECFNPRSTYNLYAVKVNETPELVATTLEGDLLVAWYNRSTKDTIVRSYTINARGKPTRYPKDEFTIKSARPRAWSLQDKQLCMAYTSTISSESTMVVLYTRPKSKWMLANVTITVPNVSSVLLTSAYVIINDGRGTATVYSNVNFSVVTSASGVGTSMAVIKDYLLVSVSGSFSKRLSFTSGSVLEATGVNSNADFVGGGILRTSSGVSYDSFYFFDASESKLSHFIGCH